MPDGFLILDKPMGLSSARALGQAKWLLPRGTKIGHAGTLDPLATGVLVAMVGRCTKLCERVMGQPKRYEATIRFGATSATDDAEGPIVERVQSGEPPTFRDVEAALARFVGVIQQLPPTFSAMKVGGRRACDRVRAGQTVELKPRAVRIDSIVIAAYEWPSVSIVINSGRGTYVRSIARDVGTVLGVGGYLSALRRTRVGPFGIERSATIEQLKERGVDAFLLPPAMVDEMNPA